MKKRLRKLSAALLSLFVLVHCSAVSAERYDDEPELIFNNVGDINCDNTMDDSDIHVFSEYMMSGAEIAEENADLNNDGVINISDYIILKDTFNRDPKEEFADIDLSAPVKGSVIQTFELEKANIVYKGDFDSDEQMVLRKMNKFRERYGLQASGIYKRGFISCDVMAKHYKERHSNLDDCDYSTTANVHTWLYTDADSLFDELISYNKYKGLILRTDYLLCIGHYEDCWVVMSSH